MLQELFKISVQRARRGYWILYLSLLLWGIYTLFKFLRDPSANTVFSAINLGIHELGHVIFAPFGELLHVLGGTIAQVLAPIISALVLIINQEDLFGAAFCLAWLSTNLFNVATYIADARTTSLPLVGLGSGPIIHDWNYLLSKFGLLSYNHLIAGIVRFFGYLSLLGFIAIASWILLSAFMSSKE